MRSIEVVVDARGRLKVEFCGFHEGECDEEMEIFSRVMSAYGLNPVVVDKRPKTSQEIFRETHDLDSQDEAPAVPVGKD